MPKPASQRTRRKVLLLLVAGLAVGRPLPATAQAPSLPSRSRFT